MLIYAGPAYQTVNPSQRAGGSVRAAVTATEAPAATESKPDARSLYMPLQNSSDVRGVAVEGESFSGPTVRMHLQTCPCTELRHVAD